MLIINDSKNYQQHIQEKGECEEMEILRVENLTKEYANGEKKLTALDSISLNVNQGEFIAVVGPSGSGKSTLLHIIGGIDKPTSERVFIDNRDISMLKPGKMTIFRNSKSGQIK